MLHRAIACGATRMVIFAQILGPSCKRIELQRNGALISTVYSKTSVAGISTTDTTGRIVVNFIHMRTRLPVIGVISILMFWGMLEMGVAMVTVCLPTLRALFQGWSPESIIRTIRSALSLGSFTLKGRSYRSSSNKCHKRGESEASLADVEVWGVFGGEGRHQAHAMGQVHAHKGEKARVPAGAIMVYKNLTQTVDSRGESEGMPEQGISLHV